MSRTYIREGHVDEIEATLEAARDVSPPSTRGPHGRQQTHVLTTQKQQKKQRLMVTQSYHINISRVQKKKAEK